MPRLTPEELDELHTRVMKTVPEDAVPFVPKQETPGHPFRMFGFGKREIPEEPPKWDLGSIVPELDGLHTAPEIRGKFDWIIENVQGYCEDRLHDINKINKEAAQGKPPKVQDILEIFDDVGVVMSKMQRLGIVMHLKTMEHHTNKEFHELEEHSKGRLHEAMFAAQSLPSMFRIPAKQLMPLLQQAPMLQPYMRMLAGLEAPRKEDFVAREEQEQAKESSDPRQKDFTKIFGSLNSDEEFQTLGKVNSKEQMEALPEERKKELLDEGVDVEAKIKELGDVPEMTEEQRKEVAERYLDTAMEMINARFYQVWKNAESMNLTPAIITSKMQGLPDKFVDEMIPNLSSVMDMEGFMQAASDARNGRDKPEEPPKFERKISWREAVDIVVSTFDNIHPELGETARDAFADGWVHAEDNKEKFYNAFSVGGEPVSFWPGNHPVLLMNFDGSVRSVETLAHEMGHALAEYLSGEHGRSGMEQINSTALHETFAHFAANMSMNELVSRCEDPEEKAYIRNQQHNHSTQVFLHNGMNGIEYSLLAASKNDHTLTREDVGNIIREEMAAMAISPEQKAHINEMEDGQAIEMISQSPHLFLSGQPYYNINYAFAEMGAMNLEQEFKSREGEDRDAFAEKYLQVITNARGMNYGTAMKHLGIEVEAPKDMLETAQAIIKDRIVAYAKHTVEYLYPEDLLNVDPNAEEEPSFLERLRKSRAEKKEAEEGEDQGPSRLQRFRGHFQRSSTHAEPDETSHAARESDDKKQQGGIGR